MHGLQVKVFDTNTRTVKIIANIACEENKKVTLKHELFLSEKPFYIVCPPDMQREKKRINIVGDKCYVDADGWKENIIVGVY